MALHYIKLHFNDAVRLLPNELECGPVPNVMSALPNIGGTVCSMPQSLANAHYQSAVQ